MQNTCAKDKYIEMCKQVQICMNMLWKEVQRQVQQHYFTTEYIADYIQVLYKGDAVLPTGLTVNQGCRHLSTGLPPSSDLRWKEQRSEV
jgi:hypothetical protein